MNKKTSSNLTFSLFPFIAPKAVPVQVPFAPVTVTDDQLRASLKRAEEYQEIERKIRESREKLLNTVTIKAKKEVVRDSRKLYSSADATIKVTPQLTAGAMTVLDIISARVAGVRVTGSGMNASVSIRNGGEPLYVLDGMTVDKSLITSLSVYDVESIDILKGGTAAIYGSRGGNGVISVLTKRGNSSYDYSQDIVPGILVSRIAGFDIPREFYAPKYDVQRIDDARPDYRSTIYWLPQIRTGSDGKAKFEFYNTDPVTTVDIRAEVLSPAGEPGFAKASYSVQ
jgi:TonB-dependent SusC/RagA subfamily outer membrane receptor